MTSAAIAGAGEQTTIALLKLIQRPGRIFRSSDIAAGPGRSERLADLTRAVGAAAFLCGTGGSRYLDPEPFSARGRRVDLFIPPSRLASLNPDAGRRATALADLADAGPNALACPFARHIFATDDDARPE